MSADIGQQLIALNTQVVEYYGDGRYREAVIIAKKACNLARQHLEKNDPEIALTLNNLAGVYESLSEYTEAEPLYEGAIAILREDPKEHAIHLANSLNSLAYLYYSMGNYDEAEPLYQKALTVRRQRLGEDHLDVAGSLYNLASLYVATGRSAEALALMQQGAAIHDRAIGQLFSIGSESQRMVYLAKLQMYFDAFLSLIVNRLSSPPEPLRAGLDMVLRRKAIGVEALAAQRDAILGGRYPALEPKLRELTALRAQIAQKILAGPGPEGIAAHQKQLRELNTQKDQLEIELAHHVPEITLAQQLRTADRQAVAHALPRETALVEFVRFDTFDFDAITARGERHWKEPFYVAFVLIAGDPDRVHLVNLGEAGPIDEQIALFRATMIGEAERHVAPASAQAPVVRSSQEAERLYLALFAPLVPALHSCKQLFLAPDGDITRLPFAVLPTDADHFLVDEYALSYLGSGRDLLRFGVKTSGQPSPPVVIADPDFDLSLEEASPQT